MTEQTKLDNCKYCGSEHIRAYAFHDGFRDVGRVECRGCGVFIDSNTLENAVTAWNRRPKPRTKFDGRVSVMLDAKELEMLTRWLRHMTPNAAICRAGMDDLIDRFEQASALAEK